MRVCIVTIAGYVHGIGGMQRHTSELARGLVQAGHEVEVITNRHPDGVSEVVHEGVLWRFVDVVGDQVDPAWHRASLEAFRAAHAKRPFDVIHSESTCALGLVRAGVHRDLPLTVKYHGNFLGLAKANARRALQSPTPLKVAREGKSFLRLCGQHFPRGNWWRFHGFHSMVPSRQQFDDQRRSHFIPRAKLHVVPNGVDATRFTPGDRTAARAALELGTGPIIVAVGRFNREKGMHTAVRALAQLPKPARLVLVGEGEEQSRLEALAASLGVLDRVVFAGPQPADVVARYLAAADAFVFPTERDEGAPMVLVEAMACGVPVVATAIDQIAEVVDGNGENGILVPLADVDATASALRALIDDPEAAKLIGARGRERILAEYTLERMVERTVAVYELAIAEHAGAQNRSGVAA
ncbi:MAG: glycosyltransferase family 4 protein [Actinomycetota bacterium]